MFFCAWVRQWRSVPGRTWASFPRTRACGGRRSLPYSLTEWSSSTVPSVARHLQGPDTGTFGARCVEPHRRWELRFDGAGALVDRTARRRALGCRGRGLRFASSSTSPRSSPCTTCTRRWAGRWTGRWAACTYEQGRRRPEPDGAGTYLRDRRCGSPRPFSRRAQFRPLRRPRMELRGLAREPPRPGRLQHVVEGGRINQQRRDPDGGRPDRDQRRFRHHGQVGDRGYPRDLALSVIRADGSRLDLTGEGVHNVTITYAEANHNLNGATRPSIPTP